MSFTTERLNIVELGWKDIQDIHKMHSYAEVMEHNTIGTPTELTDTEKILNAVLEDKDSRDKSHFSWTIRLKSNDEFIGEIGLNLAPARYQKGEVHYSIMPDHWSHGYATEALKGLIDYAFDKMNLHRIEAGVSVENLSSIKVLEKVGMTREGRKRQILPIRGEWKDNFFYAILYADTRDY